MKKIFNFQKREANYFHSFDYGENINITIDEYGYVNDIHGFRELLPYAPGMDIDNYLKGKPVSTVISLLNSYGKKDNNVAKSLKQEAKMIKTKRRILHRYL